MSDQDAKPVEAVEAEIPTTNAETSNDATAPEAPAEEPTEATKADENDADANDAKSKSAVNNPPEGMLRTSGRRNADDKNFRNNVKFDPSVLPTTDDPKQIRTQVEFYFSNSNLPTDKFMSELVGGAENKAVPIKQISSFKRMKRFQPYSAVVAALKESKMLIVEGAEDEETVRRKVPFDPAKKNQTDEQSIYAKGFGDETPTAQTDIEAFFTQYGEINSVRLRRAANKAFKGSVFVEWADKETADKFMALDPKPEWKDHPLMILWKKDYVDQKNEDIREGRVDPNGSGKFRGGSFRGQRGGNSRRGRDNRGGDSDDWKKRREEDQRNGFKDRRDRKDNRGRGRGRGGNRGRGNRDRQDRQDRQDGTNEKDQRDARDVGRPKINISGEGEKENGKRARDDEAQGGEPPAKKVDTKEAAAEAA